MKDNVNIEIKHTGKAMCLYVNIEFGDLPAVFLFDTGISSPTLYPLIAFKNKKQKKRRKEGKNMVIIMKYG